MDVCLAIRTSFALHGVGDSLQSTLERSIIGIKLQSLLKGVIGTKEVTLSVQSSALAAPALGPVRLNLNSLLSVRGSILPVLFRGICCRSVAVEDVVLGLDSDSLGELVAKVIVSNWNKELRKSELGATGFTNTYMASSKFFSAMALLPKALSSSAEAIANKLLGGICEKKEEEKKEEKEYKVYLSEERSEKNFTVVWSVERKSRLRMNRLGGA